MFKTGHILLILFCLKKYQFLFLLMLRTSPAKVYKKKMHRNAYCSTSKTVTRVPSLPNERYLAYLYGTLWKCFNVKFYVFRCVKLGSKKKSEDKLRTPTKNS